MRLIAEVRLINKVLKKNYRKKLNDIGSRLVMIEKSFKKCCISNSLDGSEDDIIWEGSEEDDTSSNSDNDDSEDSDESDESDD